MYKWYKAIVRNDRPPYLQNGQSSAYAGGLANQFIDKTQISFLLNLDHRNLQDGRTGSIGR